MFRSWPVTARSTASVSRRRLIDGSTRPRSHISGTRGLLMIADATPKVLMSGIAFGEQPRWHDARLWFSDWGPGEVIAVDLDGRSEVMLHVGSFPCCADWLPDGRLLVVSTRDGLLLRQEPDGSLVTHANLATVSRPPAETSWSLMAEATPTPRCSSILKS